MCLRTLARLPFLGRVPNKEEILVSSQEGEMELLLPAKLELLERLRGWWWLLELDENLPELSCEGKSLEKKQLSSVVLAALQGPGEYRSPNTLAWSLSSVITLLQLLSLEKRRPKRRLMGELKQESMEKLKLLSFKLPENIVKTLLVKAPGSQDI